MEVLIMKSGVKSAMRFILRKHHVQNGRRCNMNIDFLQGQLDAYEQMVSYLNIKAEMYDGLMKMDFGTLNDQVKAERELVQKMWNHIQYLRGLNDEKYQQLKNLEML
jgi:hypothetical protein